MAPQNLNKVIIQNNTYKGANISILQIQKTLTRYNAGLVSYLRSPSSKIKTNANKQNRKLSLKSGIYTTLQLQYLLVECFCLIFSMYLDDLF